MNEYENETPKYKRKKESSVSKSSSKSKHKHKYEDCLLIHEGKPYKSSYCKICRKVGDVKWMELVPCGNATSRMLSAQEIFDKYVDLQQFTVTDLWVKYLPD